ncbi:ECF transporter S component [Anaerosolibacter sp.]|uniref:ECF transporter S component n=1 Tax=Anaerosolibacter sp. TaxID=1872527 RepID=UPI0039EFC4C7
MRSEDKVYVSPSSKTKDIVISGLLISMVFVATKFINIRLPISVNGGLIHLGNTMLFLAAIVFGKRKGAIAGACGMGLFDVVSGWMAWAPFTFVIRGIMGYIIGSIAYTKDRNGNSFLWNLVGIILSGIFMISGYYITEGILYGNWISPITSIPGNITQLVVGAILGLPIAAAMKKTNMIK